MHRWPTSVVMRQNEVVVGVVWWCVQGQWCGVGVGGGAQWRAFGNGMWCGVFLSVCEIKLDAGFFESLPTHFRMRSNEPHQVH